MWGIDLVRDCRLAFRQALRSRGLTIVIITTLGIGIAANVTLVGAVMNVLLRAPDHVRDPDRVVRLLVLRRDGRGGAVPAGNNPTVIDMRRDATAFAAVAGFASRQLSMGLGREAVDLRVTLVTADFFPLLAAKPLLGRTFTPADGYPRGEAGGGPALAVLSEGFWRRAFGGDVGVLGHPISIGERVYSVVGVMPNGFRGVEPVTPDVWVPVAVAADDPNVRIGLSDRSTYSLSLVARLGASSTRAAAERQATVAWERTNRGASGSTTPVRVVAAPIALGRGPDAPREAKVTIWLAGVSTLVLLITCANVANLLLGRAVVRRREIAIRIALGARPARLARQMLAEGVVLAVVSGAAALGLTLLAGPLVQHALGGEVHGPLIDPRLLAFTAAIALGAGTFVSLAPMLHSARDGQVAELRTNRAAGARGMSRMRVALLATQSALCMVLLVGAGLFALSLRRVSALDLGIDAEHTVRAIVRLDRLLLSNAELQATYDEMLMRVRAVPGVIAAALASSDPYGAGRAVAAYTPAHGPEFYWPAEVGEVPMEAAVGAGFFRAVGAASLRGRDFEPTDDRGAPRVAIINAPLARTLYPGEDALGKCIMLPDRSDDRDSGCITVVGVLPGVWYRTLLDRDRPIAYVPLAQRTADDGVWRPQGIFVRVHGNPSAGLNDIRRALQDVRADLPAVRVRLMSDVVAAETRPWRLGTMVFVAFGAVALVIAVVGLYGVVSFSVAQRSFEIAVRLALGARRRDILATVAGEGLKAVTLGLALGTVCAVFARRWVGALLFQTSADDPGVIAFVAALLLGVGFIAALLPTVRAYRLGAASLLSRAD